MENGKGEKHFSVSKETLCKKLGRRVQLSQLSTLEGLSLYGAEI